MGEQQNTNRLPIIERRAVEELRQEGVPEQHDQDSKDRDHSHKEDQVDGDFFRNTLRFHLHPLASCSLWPTP